MKGWQIVGASDEAKGLIESVLTDDVMAGISEQAMHEAGKRLLEGAPDADA
jgi:hypothetical protein